MYSKTHSSRLINSKSHCLRTYFRFEVVEMRDCDQVESQTKAVVQLLRLARNLTTIHLHTSGSYCRSRKPVGC